MTDNELVKAEREKELVECLTWLQHRMDEYDDKEAYQDDYKMASIAWNFIRARMAENAELREAQRWVPVGERLPDRITNKVIVLCKNGYVGFGHYEKFQGTETWYNLENHKPFTDWDLEDCETYEVTHWQPLPAAPKGE